MLKKVVVGTVLVGLIGILVFGAINRTLDKTGKVAKAQGQGLGRGRSAEELASGQGYGRGRSETELNAWGGNSRGAGQGGAAERQYSNYDAAPEATMTYEGTVVQVPEPGVELVIETSEGEELEIGTGPMDLAARGFALKAGEPLQVKGYWEDNEFKAAQLTRLSTGQTFALRDEFGRPVWAGRGRNTQHIGWGGSGNQGRE